MSFVMDTDEVEHRLAQDDDFQHFISYSGLRGKCDEGQLRMANATADLAAAEARVKRLQQKELSDFDTIAAQQARIEEAIWLINWSTANRDLHTHVYAEWFTRRDVWLSIPAAGSKHQPKHL